jgi:hypothetical protein
MRKTPDKRYQHIQRSLKQYDNPVHKDAFKLAHLIHSAHNKKSYDADTYHAFFNTIEHVYATSRTPLIEAFTFCSRISDDIHKHICALDEVIKDCTHKDRIIEQKAYSTQQDLKHKKHALASSLATIKNHPRFLKECSYVKIKDVAQKCGITL